MLSSVVEAAEFSRPVGRPANASQAEVLAAASRELLAGRRIEVRAIAAEFGVSRATIYRWFGSREGLLAEVSTRNLVAMLEQADAEARGRGAERILNTLRLINKRLAASEALRSFIKLEPAGLQILTSSSGQVQPRIVANLRAYLERVAAEDGYRSPVDTATLAYAMVRLSEAFLYDDSVVGMQHEIDRLHDVHAALLGVALSDSGSR
ncbi:MAG: TetR family transcriptional regulator [Actinophytocola sp.]|nr:TetR family transcriptional regulator [Actinophytocola sp.]